MAKRATYFPTKEEHQQARKEVDDWIKTLDKPFQVALESYKSVYEDITWYQACKVIHVNQNMGGILSILPIAKFKQNGKWIISQENDYIKLVVMLSGSEWYKDKKKLLKDTERNICIVSFVRCEIMFLLVLVIY